MVHWEILLLIFGLTNVISENAVKHMPTIAAKAQEQATLVSAIAENATAQDKRENELPDFLIQDEALSKLPAVDVTARAIPSLNRDAIFNSSLPLPRYRIYYFDFPGRAEPIRMLFHYAGEPFQDFRVPSDKWKSHYKNNTPYGHVPILVDLHGKSGKRTLAESYAILRYLARKFGLSGANLLHVPRHIEEAEETEESDETAADAEDVNVREMNDESIFDTQWIEAKVDEFADFHRDVGTDFHSLMSSTEKQRTPEQIVRAAALADKYFGIYERQLSSCNRYSNFDNTTKHNADGFLFSREENFAFSSTSISQQLPVTWVDLLVANFFEEIKTLYPRVFDAWPCLDEFRKRVRDLSQLRSYFAQRDAAAKTH